MKEEVVVKQTSVELIIQKLRGIDESQKGLLLTINEKLDSYKKLEFESWIHQGTPFENIDTSEDLIFQLLKQVEFNNDCLLEIKNRLNEIF